MESFDIKRFMKGIIIIIVFGLIIGVGRGVIDTIHFLNHPSNVYNYTCIHIPVGIDDLSNARFQTSSFSQASSFTYELDNGEMRGGASIFLLNDEDKQVAGQEDIC